ncbi:MAG: polysaccharide deacetylase family protein [Bacteroidales bacterium]|nr:polysaccharide deacetylase family protein [Bacteroidales bacterium]
MNYRLTLFYFLLSFGFLSQAQTNKICFTIDDLPLSRLSKYNPDEHKSITTGILSSLKEYQIPAIGFVNENKLMVNEQTDKNRKDLLVQWLENGMELGNHTYSHPDYNNVNFEVFKEEISKGQIITDELCTQFHRPVRYFRHPYLHRGNSKSKVDSLERHLKAIGLIEAPVTIDNSEWIFASAYDSAKLSGNTGLMEIIGKEYVDYMESKLHHFEKQSQELFGRNISHILLIHANALNGDYLDELAAMLLRNQYSFVSLEDILKDPAYQSEDTYYKSNGISWLHRWAITRGYKKDFFIGEPTTPDFIKKLARVEYE